MHGDTQTNCVQDFSVNYWGFGPRTSTILCSGMLVATSFALGADWLGTSIVGLPLGAYLMGAAGYAAHLHATGRLWNRGGKRQTDTFVRGERYDVVKALHAETAPESGHTLAFKLGTGVRQIRREIERVNRAFSARPDVVRIGVDLSDGDFAAVENAWNESMIGGASVEWHRAEAGLVKNGPDDCREFDALVRRGADGSVHVFVPTSEDAPAAWADWSSPPAIGYPSVFPARMDCEKITLGACDFSNVGVCELVSSLCVAAGVFGRTEARHANIGRMAGRVHLENETEVVSAAMGRVADAIMSIDPQSDVFTSAACKAAARAVLAQMATRERTLGSNDRMETSRAAWAAVANEPESMLRLGAIQLGMGKDAEGLETLSRACTGMRRAGTTCETDPLAFVMSEAEMGNGDSLTLGRIAAGLTLTFATAPEKSAAYLKDDLIDDLECSSHFSEDPEGVSLVKKLLQKLTNSGESMQKTTTRRRKKAA